MFAEAVEELGRGLVADVGEVGAVEGYVGREVLGEVETEGKLALEPRFDGVAVGGDDLRRGIRGESADVLVADLHHEGGIVGCGEGVAVGCALKEDDTGEDEDESRCGGPTVGRKIPGGGAAG